MDLAQVERLLCELGVDRRNPALWAAVIRFVQCAEGSQECFGAPGSCVEGQCAWRSLCQTPAELQEHLLERRPWPGSALSEAHCA